MDAETETASTRLDWKAFKILLSIFILLWGVRGFRSPFTDLQRSIMQASTLNIDSSCLLNIKCFFIISVLFMYLDYLYSCQWCLKFFLSRLQNTAKCEESGILEGAPCQEDPEPCSCNMRWEVTEKKRPLASAS